MQTHVHAKSESNADVCAFFSCLSLLLSPTERAVLYL